MHTLRQQAEFGQRVRVVSAESVASLEALGPLPAVVALGGRTLYEVVYSESGQAEGAIRFTDPGWVAEWERFIEALFEPGEEIASYFDREVARHVADGVRTRYVLINPGGVSTGFCGELDPRDRRAGGIAEEVRQARRGGDPPPGRRVDNPSVAPLSAYAQHRPISLDHPFFGPVDAARLEELSRACE